MTQVASPTHALRVLQRAVFPAAQDLDVVPLYVDTDMERGAGLANDPAPDGVAIAVVGAAQTTIRFGLDETLGPIEGFDARRAATVRAGCRVSFATYFNAFPASYWRRWTSIDSVTLRVRIVGEGTIVVYRSTAKGHSHPVESTHVDADDPQSIELTLPLTHFIDGGWYWFDLAAGSRPIALIEADWVTATNICTVGRISIGITTFNRPDFLVDLLRTVGTDAEVLNRVDALYVVDQGTSRVRDHPDFADAAKGIGDRLQLIEQANLGGSGGFSRAMSETLRTGTSDYVLLLDDDVNVEPEGILRAITFADLARRPTIVGGHMFSLHDRSVLHAFSETVAPYPWWWRAAPHTKPGHDFGRQSLRHTPWLHRRVDADYNGWWMCMIPTRVIRELGLAFPAFIKWDDAEYGLRAREAGYPTVSMPGIAVWHVPWQDKNDALDWQAYYHLRNRLVAALLHSPYERGGRVVAETLETQIQHLLSMQYSSAALRIAAVEDLLSGPDHLHRDLLAKPRSLRELQSRFSDARSHSDVDSFPPVRRRRPPAKGRKATSPTNKIGLMVTAGLGAARQLRPMPSSALLCPLTTLPYQDASWWTLANVDSAIVSAADGATATWYRRDPRLFRSLLRRSVVLHGQLMRDWPRLRAQYRDAAPAITSPEQWQHTFATTSQHPAGQA
jgi:galactofuranosylgalactofuranosylrhamnosyl-N-acetylglucosaminyl-diphospho-decaprenol beta-1,5/1,6-galactofuranosyltransferase